MIKIILITIILTKKTVDSSYFALTEKIELTHKFPKLKVDDRARFTKHKNIFSKLTLNTGQEKYF